MPHARTPVLLVHGHGSSSGAFEHMAGHLGQSYPMDYLLAVDIVPNTSPNVRAAEEFVAPAVDRLLARASAAAAAAGYRGSAPTKVDIVAHSMGAVSARWYAARVRPDRVRTWISVAGANHGSDFLCSSPDDAAREMCPAFAGEGGRQAIQIELNGGVPTPVDESPFGRGVDRAGVRTVAAEQGRSVAYFTVRIEHDELITPGESALLDGAGGIPVALPAGVSVAETSPGNFLFIQPTDHDAVLNDTGLHRLISALLAAR